jgi:Domain of unknown function (DUF2017)
VAQFERSDDHTIVRLEDYENDLLRQLIEEMKVMLDAGISQDPVHKRLYPDAYQDEDAARSYRELIGDELKRGKLAAMKTMEASLDRLVEDQMSLTRDEAEAWLTALTDLRLAIGTRLEVTEEKMAAEIDPDDPEAPAISVLHWLGWMQESMLESMTAGNGERSVEEGS